MCKSILIFILLSSVLVATETKECKEINAMDASLESCTSATPNWWTGANACCYFEFKYTSDSKVETFKNCENVFKGEALKRKIEEYKLSYFDKNYEFVTFDCSSSYIFASLLVLVSLLF